jgi:folate-dependent tRNA-U54 methylase TrmFO/GidA
MGERGRAAQRRGAAGSLVVRVADEPSNATWAMFPPLEDARLRKRERYEAMAERALADLGPRLSRQAP